MASNLRDSDTGLAAGEVALDGDDLVVVLSELHAHLGPGIEVRLGVDNTGGALVLADGPVLGEGVGTEDAGGVDTSSSSDLVVAAIDVDVALNLGLGRRVVRAERLNDVVLNERAGGPAVDGEVAVAVGLVVTSVLDLAVKSVSIVE